MRRDPVKNIDANTVQEKAATPAKEAGTMQAEFDEFIDHLDADLEELR